MMEHVTGTAGADGSNRTSQGRLIDPAAADDGLKNDSQPTPTGFHDRQIVTLPDGKFRLKDPIPVRLEGDADEGWIASFDEANIAMSGDTVADALDALAENIVFAMELHLSEENDLNDDLREVLATLRRYIEVLDDHQA